MPWYACDTPTLITSILHLITYAQLFKRLLVKWIHQIFCSSGIASTKIRPTKIKFKFNDVGAQCSDTSTWHFRSKEVVTCCGPAVWTKNQALYICMIKLDRGWNTGVSLSVNFMVKCKEKLVNCSQTVCNVLLILLAYKSFANVMIL